jgi:hypothetical protein
LTSPLAAPARAVACASATTLDAVISPPNTLSPLTSAEALAVAVGSATAETLAFAEPVVTMPL